MRFSDGGAHSDRTLLDLHAQNVVLKAERDELLQQVSFLEAQIESLRDALDLANSEI